MRIPGELIFYQKPTVYAIVPFGMKLKQHIMVIPHRKVLGLKDLSNDEIAEYGLTVKFLSTMLENLYEGTSSTVFMQVNIIGNQ